mmetsp:Transcript_5012/g.11248  ORF Transcript_5012/g.11248 Transcript_5012/m.11248 type:complete len:201 (-) Transcript_5012:607-1209(-)
MLPEQPSSFGKDAGTYFFVSFVSLSDSSGCSFLAWSLEAASRPITLSPDSSVILSTMPRSSSALFSMRAWEAAMLSAFLYMPLSFPQISSSSSSSLDFSLSCGALDCSADVLMVESSERAVVRLFCESGCVFLGEASGFFGFVFSLCSRACLRAALRRFISCQIFSAFILCPSTCAKKMTSTRKTNIRKPFTLVRHSSLG